MSDHPNATLTGGLTAADAARLDEVILSLCFLKPAEMTNGLDLIGDLGYDSLGMLELISAVEAEFDLGEVDETSALQVQTVGDLRRLLAETLG